MSAKPTVAMTAGELQAFLRSRTLAVVCATTPSGDLVAHVARYQVEDRGLGDLVLDLPGPARDLMSGGPACALIDTYPTYDGIKGAMLRGRIETTGGPGAGRLRVERASGFDFAKAKPAKPVNPAN